MIDKENDKLLAVFMSFIGLFTGVLAAINQLRHFLTGADTEEEKDVEILASKIDALEARLETQAAQLRALQQDNKLVR